MNSSQMSIFTGLMLAFAGFTTAGYGFFAGPYMDNPIWGAVIMLAGMGLIFLGARCIDKA